MVRPARVTFAVVAVALALAGCTDAGPGAAPAPSAAPPTFALNLPPCGKPPSPDPDPPPPGAVVPPGTVITATREQPPLLQLNGYVASTPRAIRTWIEAQPDLEVVSSEDEGYESELLVSDGTWRTFVKARAICDEGSLLAEVIAPEDSGAVLPTPAGTAAP